MHVYYFNGPVVCSLFYVSPGNLIILRGLVHVPPPSQRLILQYVHGSTTRKLDHSNPYRVHVGMRPQADILWVLIEIRTLEFLVRRN